MEHALLLEDMEGSAMRRRPRHGSGGAGRRAGRKGGKSDGAENGGGMALRLGEGMGEIEMHIATADGAADLGIGGAQVALLVMRQRLILLLLRQRMRDAMRHRTLLDEQQGEDEECFQERGAEHAVHSSGKPCAFQEWYPGALAPAIAMNLRDCTSAIAA